MGEKKRVLILTADAGFGHRSAANAIAAALRESYPEQCEVSVLNPLDDKKVPSFLRDTQTDYDNLVRKWPDFYKMNFQLSDSSVPLAVLESALTVMLFGVIRSLINDFKPDVILTTHPFYLAPLNTYITTRRLSIPFLTVITDLTNVHHLWFNQGADLSLLPTDEVFREAIGAGLSSETCCVTGIPVNPIFSSEKRSKAEIRSELGWAPDVTTALVAGSARVRNLLSVLHVLNHSGMPLQFVLVAGGDKGLFEKFKTTEWHAATHIYNYVDTMPKFMKASDLIIGKAGGLTVTEALACGVPLLLVDVSPGQEEGNAKYILKYGAGELADSPVQALEILFHWLQREQELLDAHAEKALALGKPKSAFRVAELAWQAADKGRSVPTSRLLTWIPRFRELLHTFNISDSTDS